MRELLEVGLLKLRKAWLELLKAGLELLKVGLELLKVGLELRKAGLADLGISRTCGPRPIKLGKAAKLGAASDPPPRVTYLSYPN